MLSSLLRSKSGRRRVPEQHSPFSSPYADRSSPVVAREQRRAARHASADFTSTEEEDTGEDGGEGHGDDGDHDEMVEEDEDEDEDGDEESPLLPLFSAAHLGMYMLKTISEVGSNTK